MALYGSVVGKGDEEEGGGGDKPLGEEDEEYEETEDVVEVVEDEEVVEEREKDQRDSAIEAAALLGDVRPLYETVRSVANVLEGVGGLLER